MPLQKPVHPWCVVAVEETGIEIHLDDPAIGANSPDLIILQIPEYRAQRIYTGVTADYGFCGRMDSIPKGPFTDMGKIHHHPQLVHPPDNRLPFLRQPVWCHRKSMSRLLHR